MLDVRLNQRLEVTACGTLRDETGQVLTLPPELKILTSLSHQWLSCAELSAYGFAAWQVERLFLEGIVDVGRTRFQIPRRARIYYKEQFPNKTVEQPFSTWLDGPPPRAFWIGLPYTNLARLGHSTASGLADILASACPQTISVLGVLPEQAPSPRSAEELKDLVGLADLLNIRLGIVGGDHRATWSMLSIVKSALPDKTVQYIHIDAHHDLYGYRSDQPPLRINHANFLADLLQHRHIDHAVLIGCRDGAAPVRAAQYDGLPISLSQSGEAWRPAQWSDSAHTHLSVDLDILDPQYAPAVSSPIDAGWTPEQLIRTIRQIMNETRIDSCSVVEAGGGDLGTTEAALAVIQELGA
ncbi:MULTISPECIES: arginase family protein [Pseudomonas]|uniref:arginase family protein n=1 Tax=Pseudomonas TaxID=286 RepID=UPI000838663A|nr:MULTISPECIES: arginase family protein [Pseudomonas]MCU7645754.1 arginase family protein [Pseudomonas piscis]QIH08629.1 hypothetical protein ATY02_18835 [Pseudomonas sp. BIOMIG1BAC]